jgi:hypothetical protein
MVLFLVSLQSSKRKRQRFVNITECVAVANRRLWLLGHRTQRRCGTFSSSSSVLVVRNARIALTAHPFNGRQWVYFDIMFAYPWISLQLKNKSAVSYS